MSASGEEVVGYVPSDTVFVSTLDRFQIGELRKHQLLETRVRCYALRHERLTPVRLSGNAGKGVGDLESGGVDGSIGGRGEDACMADAHADLSRRQPDQVRAIGSKTNCISKYVNAWMYLYVYLYVFVCIYLYVFVLFIFMNVFVCSGVCSMYLYYLFLCIYIYVYRHTWMHLWMHECM